jgi:serine/threonine-protein kinase RsbW
MKKYKLKIESKTEKLVVVREFISETARKYGFVNEEVGKIALAVDEACTNIIKHAYHYAPDQVIDIEIRTDKSNFEVIIKHTGILFDPSAVKSPDLHDYIVHPRRGGLGMHLMRLMMDEVEYKILPQNICEVHLVKKLVPS